MSLEDLLAWIPPGHPDETLVREIQFDRLPEPGKKKTDTTLQTGLQINF